MGPTLHPERDPQRIIRHFSDIKILADSERNGLGFLTEQALRDAITRRKLLGLIDRSGEQDKLVGYLLYSGVFPNAKVQQIATVKTYRRRGIGSALIRTLVADLEQLGFLTIRADVAADLDKALAFYARNRFKRIRTQLGGRSRRRQIVVHIRELETENLFTIPTNNTRYVDFGIRRRSASSTPFFALDLNVYFDLARNRSHSASARRLFGSALNHDIRLTTADEFVRELRRTSKDETSDGILQLALRLPRMPDADRSEQRVVRDQIHDLVFVKSGATSAGSSQSLSDASHLAHATLARASAFVTRDGTILASRAELLERFGVDVVTVEELLAILPPDRGLGATQPRSGHGFVCTDASSETVRNYMNSQDLQAEVVSEFATDGGHLMDSVRRVVRRDGDVLACAVLLAPRTTEPVCRMIVHARPEALDGELYTDHLLDALLRHSSVTAATAVELECVTGQSTLAKLAKARGFITQRSPTVRAKVVMGRPITTTTWTSAAQELRRRTGLKVPNEMPERSNTTAFSIRTNQDVSLNMSLRGLEDLLGPTLLVGPGRDGVIVPITRDYSTLLLGDSRQMSLGLTDDKDAAFLSRRAYVNTPRAASVMRPDSPILFYESKRSKGVGGIVAVGRIVDAVILRKQDIPSDTLRRLVVDNVGGFSSTDEVLVSSFDNLFEFPTRIPLNVLREIGAINASNLVTAQKISGQTVIEILDRGWRNV